MTKLVVYVEFTLKPGKIDRFFDAVRINAAASAADEPGCRKFDVMRDRDPARDNVITLYEIYDDDAAFAAHRESPHFKAFSAATEALIEDRVIRKLTVWENGAA